MREAQLRPDQAAALTCYRGVWREPGAGGVILGGMPSRAKTRAVQVQHVENDVVVSQFFSYFGTSLPRITQDARPASVNPTERLERVSEALDAGKVLSRSQLRRYFQVRDDELKLWLDAGVLLQEEVIFRPVHGRMLEVTTQFFALNEAELVAEAPTLAHSVGANEALLSLRIPPSLWRSAGLAQAGNAPDARLAVNERETLAVEYDRGSYTSRRIEEKVQSFREQGYLGLILVVPPHDPSWGQGRGARALRLRELLLRSPALNTARWPVVVMTAQWWDAQDVSFKRTERAKRPGRAVRSGSAFSRPSQLG